MENGLGVGVYVGTIVDTIMRDIKYKVKHIRMNEKTWEILKKERKKSGLSWNLFLLELLKK